jgi:TM2 domain-containing membrane protein YozV
LIVGGTGVGFLIFFVDAAILAIIQKRKLAKFGDKKVEKFKNPAIYINFWQQCGPIV